jgi:muramoyltetrapeptide carboxypeptidase
MVNFDPATRRIKMKELKIPPYLKEGDCISIISPASWIEEERVMPAVRMLEGSGFRVRTGDHVFSRSGPFAGTDDERLRDIQAATDDPEVKAVLCSRGGYGMARIIDRIDFSALAAHPKWYIGYSDITVLHLWLNTVCGVVSLHAEMPLNYAKPWISPECYMTMISALKGEAAPVTWSCHGKESFTVEGPVTGGNLSLIYSLNGTRGEPDTDGAILFIEETGEYYYHLDRMLNSLRLTGRLKNLAALIVGGMEKITEGDQVFNQSVEDVVMNMAGGYGYPVLFGFPAGHISDNRALYMGRRARLGYDGKAACLSWL